MADANAELAFLASMRNDQNGGYQENGSPYQQQQNVEDEDDDEDYDPSSLIPDTTYPSAADTAKDSPTENWTQNEGKLSSVDPSASGSIASHNPSRTVSRASSVKLNNTTESVKQPRTVGGFIVDGDDDEDESTLLKPQVAGSHGLLNVSGENLQTPQRTPSQMSNKTDVSIIKTAQEAGVSGVAPTGATDTVPHLSTVLPDAGASSAQQPTVKPSETISAPVRVNGSAPATPSTMLPKTRLPHDRVGILEDRIAEDPRGDMDAWRSLISEHRKRSKWDEARAVYERFFKVFPSAAEMWVDYANMELELNEFFNVEQVFAKSLMSLPNVQLWSLYLDYVRRRNNLVTDTTGNARQTVSQAYDFVIQNVGIDKDSGQVWQDYVHFIRTGPGNPGGSHWQDKQKMDLLRSAYQRAICVPTQAINALWKEYDSFEMGLDRLTVGNRHRCCYPETSETDYRDQGRRLLQERSPAYVTARSSHIALQNITRELKRTTLPTLPPALGVDGDLEYMKQVDLWKKWIQWEKDDPLVLKEEDLAAYKARIVYVYKQASMALRFWPELWFDAAEFCFQNGLESDGNEFLTQGFAANPESCLLAFKRADRNELTTANEEGEGSLKRRGDAVREPYDKVLNALYDLINKAKVRETRAIARIQESFIQQPQISRQGSADSKDEDDDQADEPRVHPQEAALKAQIEAIQHGSAMQIKLLSRTVSFIWIALMRAMRRVQGKGKVNDPVGGSRQIFTDARKRGRLTSDVYVASALIEYHCYKDPAATRIFEKGMKLFPEDEAFALEYLKHLISINDITNARAVFETTVSKLAQKPETLQKAKPIYTFFHGYEAQYGELSQINKLEKRMADLFPEDPQLSRFAHRYTAQAFDPTAIRPIISPATQARPKAMPSIERLPSIQNSPRPFMAQPVQAASPKRPFVPDESDNEQPRKLARGESPLKGAAGRRQIAQQKQIQRRIDGILENSSHAPQIASMPLPELPRGVTFLLSIIPRAQTYHAAKFNPERMVDLLRNVDIPQSLPSVQRAPPGSYSGFGL
ncbi:hypothetical protein LTR04_003432 [Oleoguttula sp. CCFEE 6159]|nr:hypothetical protein LTR04_003432 [Oleoguttula sp. CCFEE 6159]